MWNSADGKAIGVSYFKERGFREDILKKFNVGYSPDVWDALTQDAITNKHTEEYLEKTGLQTENWTFYEVFGLFRLAVIAQQIYYRYYHKQTNNQAFKDFWIVIHAIHIRALKRIGLHKLEANALAQKYMEKLKEILAK